LPPLSEFLDRHFGLKVYQDAPARKLAFQLDMIAPITDPFRLAAHWIEPDRIRPAIYSIGSLHGISVAAV
jgi:hypothetical protein